MSHSGHTEPGHQPVRGPRESGCHRHTEAGKSSSLFLESRPQASGQLQPAGRRDSLADSFYHSAAQRPEKTGFLAKKSWLSEGHRGILLSPPEASRSDAGGPDFLPCHPIFPRLPKRYLRDPVPGSGNQAPAAVAGPNAAFPSAAGLARPLNHTVGTTNDAPVPDGRRGMTSMSTAVSIG